MEMEKPYGKPYGEFAVRCGTVPSKAAFRNSAPYDFAGIAFLQEVVMKTSQKLHKILVKYMSGATPKKTTERRACPAHNHWLSCEATKRQSSQSRCKDFSFRHL
ncbi:hypothetical protein PoB_002871200 [Plakobranchus ocellatus]|uniref:Uncharacterized protein n=1 Tax=Plakobranchus ocellatus TaxID=259542 RepID=A0AAV4A5N0_9GAST|nr:hypothetical protein PoB_002871200 [Plakobranchus ocellatus]